MGSQLFFRGRKVLPMLVICRLECWIMPCPERRREDNFETGSAIHEAIYAACRACKKRRKSKAFG